MKTKTIKAIIHRKFNAFLESITDPVLKQLVEKNTICTGGCIASMLLKEEVNDYDFYFRNFETALAVATHYVQVFKTNKPPKFAACWMNYVQFNNDVAPVRGVTGRVKIIVQSAGAASAAPVNDYEYFEGDQTGQSGHEYIEKLLDIEPDKEEKSKSKAYRPLFLSANAISLSDDVQLIIRFFGEPNEIHQNYDFVHVTNFWTSWDNELVLRKEALEALMTKELRYIGSKYPLCSIIRVRKFLGRGWTITAGQILKMAINLQEYDLKNFAVLEDQLTGVDVAYFNDLLARVKDNSPDAQAVDANYLCQLIDKLF